MTHPRETSEGETGRWTQTDDGPVWTPRAAGQAKADRLDAFITKAGPALKAAEADYKAMMKRAERDRTPHGQNDARTFKGVLDGLGIARTILNALLEGETRSPSA